MKAHMFSRRHFLAAALVLSTAIGSHTAYAADPVELQFWDMNWGGPEYAVTAEKLVDQYNNEQKDVKVIYRSIAWRGWYETFLTAIASGSAPDISTGAGFQAVDLYDQGAILPIDDLIADMKADGSLDEFPDYAMDTVQYDGHYLALPWRIDMRVILYREDLLEAKGVKPPQTWQEFRDAAKAVTGDGVYGYVSAGDSSGVHSFFTMAINNNGGLFDEGGKVAVESPATMESIEFLSSLVQDGSVNPASVGYGTSDRRESFLKGRAAFVLDVPGIADSAPEVKDKIKVLPPLKSDSGHVGTVNFINNIMLYNQTEHPKEALHFLRWWSENQKPLWTDGNAGSMPARKSFLEDPYFQNNENVKYAIDHYLPISRSIAARKGGTFPQLNKIDGDTSLTTLIQQLWQGRPAAEIAKPVQVRLEEIMGE